MTLEQGRLLTLSRILSRVHSNYLAQINILMNERQEQTADVLGKLTVLGTIVLPMNIICGMWGMNVKVPGQDIDNLYWFWSSIFPRLFNSTPASMLMSSSYGRPVCIWPCLVPHRQASLQDCVDSWFDRTRPSTLIQLDTLPSYCSFSLYSL